jgi:hypothetical protein
MVEIMDSIEFECRKTEVSGAKSLRRRKGAFYGADFGAVAAIFREKGEERVFFAERISRDQMRITTY